MKNIWTYLTILSLCLLSSIASLNAAADNILFVQGSGVNVRKGPGTDFSIIIQLSSGTKVIERLRQGEWVDVKVLGADQTGWIHASLLKSEKTEDLYGDTGSKEDSADPEASQSPAAPILSAADTTQAVDKVDKHSESISGKYLFEKVAVVDIQRILYESKKGKDARKYVEGLVSLRSEKDLAKTEQELISQIVKDIKVVIDKYAGEKGFSLILSKQEVLFFVKEKFDITDEIIRFYDEHIEALKSIETE